jgi:nickel-dependent lactate racemase
MKTVSVPSRLWHENTEIQLSFPDSWDVDILNSPGLDKPGLELERIKYKAENPLDGPGLEELARGRKQAVIVFDDMTRPTPVRDIAPYVLDILHRAGMKPEQIRFLWALGSHGAYDMVQARKKLGDHIVENYAVYNHDPFQNTVRAGRTPTGVEVWFNREFMNCDLKIGIGCITPHVHAGFGGGAKLIMPGVAGIETINQFHNQLFRDQARTGLGNFENNIMRAECDAAGDLAGLDFKVDCLINRRGQITDLYSAPSGPPMPPGPKRARITMGFLTAQDMILSYATHMLRPPSRRSLSSSPSRPSNRPGDRCPHLRCTGRTGSPLRDEVMGYRLRRAALYPPAAGLHPDLHEKAHRAESAA